ncbi:MAG: NAD(P)H-hydrate epimerase [Planctomycetota bacterium]
MNLTPDQMRALDLATARRFALPTLLLMEHASLAVARQAAEMLLGSDHAVALCGGGHNGGDAAAAARHLFNWGRQVDLILVGREPEDADVGDHAVNFRAARRLGIPFTVLEEAKAVAERAAAADLWIDGLVGTGLTGTLRPPLRDVIEQLAQRGGRSLAVDIPSGLSGLTGAPMPVALPAEVTVTFGFAKTGLQTPSAQPYVGRLVVADIGYPRPIMEDPLRFA